MIQKKRHSVYEKYLLFNYKKRLMQFLTRLSHI